MIRVLLCVLLCLGLCGCGDTLTTTHGTYTANYRTELKANIVNGESIEIIFVGKQGDRSVLMSFDELKILREFARKISKCSQCKEVILNTMGKYSRDFDDWYCKVCLKEKQKILKKKLKKKLKLLK